MKRFFQIAAANILFLAGTLNLQAETSQKKQSTVSQKKTPEVKSTTPQKKTLETKNTVPQKKIPETKSTAPQKKTPEAKSTASQKKTSKVKTESCDFKLFGNDRMQFVDEKKTITKKITVPRSCSHFTVHFEYDGKMKSNIMGHNWLLTEKENKEKVSQNALKSGIKNNYLPDASMSSFLVAGSTKILGGGEGDFHKEDIVIDMSKIKDDKDYVYFCAFPGHALIMKGVFMRAKAPVKEKKTTSKKRAAPSKTSQPTKKQKTK